MNIQVSEKAIQFVRSNTMKRVKEIISIHNDYKFVINDGDVFGVDKNFAKEIQEIVSLICLIKSYKGTHVDKWTALRTAKFMLDHLERTRDENDSLLQKSKEDILRKAIDVYIKVYH